MKVTGIDGFQVRNMTRDDLRSAYSWSIDEGWNIGKYDHDVFFQTDPAGFFIGELHGEPVGCVSGVAYGGTFGFVGIYIVRPEYRGKGYGLQIFNEAISYLGERTIGLDGVIAQQDNYRKSGFQFAHRNIRFGWTPGVTSFEEASLVPASDVPFELLATFDARHFPARRETFLRSFIAEPEMNAYVSVNNGAIVGFGAIRKFAQGWSLGPLFADTPQIAEDLFLKLSSLKCGEQVFLDVPALNEDALELAERYSMDQVFETARMYKGSRPELPLGCIYGITSFELG